jgi:hypothetical protein
MAILCEFGHIEQDALAQAFARSYREDPNRKYGASMHEVLHAIGDGADWRPMTTQMFCGKGSWGNDAARRTTA